MEAAINKGCCQTQVCPCMVVSPTPLAHNMHEHSYCHLDTTPKYAKKTVWKERTVTGIRPVLVDNEVEMKKTVIDYKLEMVPSIKHGHRMVERTKTRTVPGTREVTTTEEYQEDEEKQFTRQVPEKYTTFETRTRPAMRQVKRIRFVKKRQMQKVLEHVKSTEQKVVTEWIPRSSMATVKVPIANQDRSAASSNAFPGVAGANMDPGAAGDDCGCYKQQCDCVGQADCDCCFPKCGCAPKSMKEYETVQVLTESHEPQVITKDVATSTPRVIEKEVEVDVPEEYFVNEPYQEQYLVEVEKERMVPEVYSKKVKVTKTRPVTNTVDFDEVQEYTVKESVPYSEPVETQVQVPFTREEVVKVIEKRAEPQEYSLVLRTPSTVIEKLPPTTVCHEHKYKHSHELESGETHSHSEEHQHPHAGDGSGLEGRIIGGIQAPMPAAGV